MFQTLKELIMEGKRMNEAESLELITSMINESWNAFPHLGVYDSYRFNMSGDHRCLC